jgi:hypothetical protein
VISKIGTNLVFKASGRANQTNFLIASPDITLPPPQWAAIATDISDLSGALSPTPPSTVCQNNSIASACLDDDGRTRG